MSKHVLIATEKPFSADARDQIAAILKAASYEVELLEKYAGKEALIAAAKRADAMIIRSDVIDAEVLAGAERLALVVRAGAGYDNVDLATAKARGVAVMNTPGQNANAVAELALAMMVYSARGQFDGKSGTELRGKTLGIHAFGAVGRAVAGIAAGFGMKVLAFDPFVTAEQIRAAGVEPVDSVDALYQRSRYVSLHIPATPETRGSIGKARLLEMPKGATLVNTARKEVIDEAGLLEVLASRADFRYVADVAPSDATLAVMREKHAAQVYVTPNKMGAQTSEANVNAGLAAARQIVAFFENGERRFVVNP
ncbi:MAG: NAD(P)-dependent oxidoreductase [Sorangiineae bacterium]|nr:NAD(P)-dependent oxidoreductase [Polyangiaceae bacterium]MEB2324070.1 NAD(P)-dependent oxidoreductase [Sorangiineae bacterium]